MPKNNKNKKNQPKQKRSKRKSKPKIQQKDNNVDVKDVKDVNNVNIQEETKETINKDNIKEDTKSKNESKNEIVFKVPEKPSKKTQKDDEFSFEDSEEISDNSHSSAIESSDLSSSLDSKESGGSKLGMQLDPDTLNQLQTKIEVSKQKVTDIKLSSPRGVVYLGHLPWGFFENQMKKFFTQFGVVTRLRLARSKKTGKSKCYAFIEFLDPVVAKIVADTMNGYMMFHRVLECAVIPPERVHPIMFFKNSHVNRRKKNIEIINSVKTNSQIHKKKRRLEKKIERRNQKLKELGIDFQSPLPILKTQNKPKKNKDVKIKDVENKDVEIKDVENKDVEIKET